MKPRIVGLTSMVLMVLTMVSIFAVDGPQLDDPLYPGFEPIDPSLTGKQDVVPFVAIYETEDMIVYMMDGLVDYGYTIGVTDEDKPIIDITYQDTVISKVNINRFEDHTVIYNSPIFNDDGSSFYYDHDHSDHILNAIILITEKQ